MRNIVISGMELCRKEISGVERYIYEVLTRLDSYLDTEGIESDLCIVYPKGETLLTKNLRNIKTETIDRWDKGLGLCRYARQHNAIIITMAPRFFPYPRQVITLYDVRPLEPQNYDSIKYRINFSLIRAYARLHRDIKIVTISKFQKKRICNLCGIPAECVYIIGVGWEHIKDIEPDYGIIERLGLTGGDYYLSVGSVMRHKNYEWLVSAARRNPEKMFVIAGKDSIPGIGYSFEHDDVNNLILTGYITEEEKKSLILKCKSLIHPSKYEGFGIPPLEALALDKSVMLSRATCLPEIYGSSADWFDPDNGGILPESASPADHNAVREVLEKYTWEKAAYRWLKLIKSI